jgi:hypothetical protein
MIRVPPDLSSREVEQMVEERGYRLVSKLFNIVLTGS